MAKQILNGKVYYEDSRGALVPESCVKALDVLRSETVEKIIEQAKEMNLLLHEFKKEVGEKIAAFVDMSFSEYGVQLGGDKGNLKLRSIDGKYLILVAQNEQIDFNELLQAAETLIGECINERAQNADPLLLAMVKAAFTRDKDGTVNARDVLKLQRYEIDDPKWNKAMKAIRDSIETAGSKEYIRFYERRGKDRKMVPISLDLACL